MSSGSCKRAGSAVISSRGHHRTRRYIPQEVVRILSWSEALIQHEAGAPAYRDATGEMVKDTMPRH